MTLPCRYCNISQRKLNAKHSTPQGDTVYLPHMQYFPSELVPFSDKYDILSREWDILAQKYDISRQNKTFLPRDMMLLYKNAAFLLRNTTFIFEIGNNFSWQCGLRYTLHLGNCRNVADNRSPQETKFVESALSFGFAFGMTILVQFSKIVAWEPPDASSADLSNRNAMPVGTNRYLTVKTSVKNFQWTPQTF